MPLTAQHAKWIVRREKRWQILLAIRSGEITILEAEKRLRKLDGET